MLRLTPVRENLKVSEALTCNIAWWSTERIVWTLCYGKWMMQESQSYIYLFWQRWRKSLTTSRTSPIRGNIQLLPSCTRYHRRTASLLLHLRLITSRTQSNHPGFKSSDSYLDPPREPHATTIFVARSGRIHDCRNRCHCCSSQKIVSRRGRNNRWWVSSLSIPKKKKES
jgi:hypothetical protein